MFLLDDVWVAPNDVKDTEEHKNIFYGNLYQDYIMQWIGQ